jgi:magnesium transporter
MPRTWAVYRQGTGEVHFDWPAERIAEALRDEDGTLWVDIADDLGGNVSGVEVLFRDVFQFHPLAIEDALSETNVAKVDDWGRYLYLAFHSIDFDPATDALRTHELDAFLGRNFLVTYHYEPMPAVDRVRTILDRDQGQRLKRRPDHVLYLLLDAVVAAYMPAVEHLDDAIDDAQAEVFERPTPRTLQKIFQVKRSAIRLHRVLGPHREVVNRLARDEYPQVGPHDRVYFRDVYDHLVRLHDTSETLRDLISGAMDTYLSVVAQRSNETMKVLTAVTVMFLPLNFIVGFFGMNFFAETLAFHASRLPNTALFMLSCLVMLGAPVLLWFLGKRRGWFGSDLPAPAAGNEAPRGPRDEQGE